MNQKKIDGWWVLYIALVIIGQRLAGIGGITGAVLISYGLQKTLKNTQYSNGKKVAYSLLYVICGVVTSILIAAILIGVIRSFNSPDPKIFPKDQTVQTVQNIETSNTSSTTKANVVTQINKNSSLQTVVEIPSDIVPKHTYIAHKINLDRHYDLYVNVTTDNDAAVFLVTENDFESIQKNQAENVKIISNVVGTSAIIPLDAGQYALLVQAADKDVKYSLILKVK